MKTLRVMSTTPENNKSGKHELKHYYDLATTHNADILLLPSSFMPYYKNSSAYYTKQDIDNLPSLLKDDNTLVVVGVNEREDNNTNFYKAVVAFKQSGILLHRRKKDLENHYIEKGFIPGDEDSKMHIEYNGLKINILECYESMFAKNWYGNPDVVLVSIGFGMKAKTQNYDCDYFTQWMTILQSFCIQMKCACITSCNGQHEDFMTIACTHSGEVIAMAKSTGLFIVDIPLVYRKEKDPYEQKC